MADFGNILNPNNTSLKLYCNTLEALTSVSVNGVPLVNGGGNPNSLVSSNPLVGTTAGGVVVFTGDESNFDCNSQSVVFVANDGLKVDDVGSSAYSTLKTDVGQTVLRNSGVGGVSIDGASGDILLTTTKLFGKVNIQSSAGLSCGGIGSINNDNNNLVVGNSAGNTIVASKNYDVILNSGETGKIIVKNDVGLDIVDRQTTYASTIQTTNTGALNVSCPNGIVNVNGFAGVSLVNGVNVVGGAGFNTFSKDGLGQLIIYNDLPIVLNAETGSINLNTVNNDVIINTGTGKLSVLSGSQFDGQMTTADIQVNANSSLLLHDTTTGNSCEMFEDSTGYCRISNPDSVYIRVVNDGQYITLQTADNGYVEFNNTFVESSAYVAVNADADFELYDENKIVLSNGKGVQIKEITSSYLTELSTDTLGDFTVLNAIGDITLNAGSAYFKSVKTNNNGVVNKVQNCQGGATGSRPVSPVLGECYYDTSLIIPIWWSGSDWRNSVGLPV